MAVANEVSKATDKRMDAFASHVVEALMAHQFRSGHRCRRYAAFIRVAFDTVALLAPLAGRIYDHAPQQNAFPLAHTTTFT